MQPRTIHHVFPYHVRHIADDESSWWDAQLGVWPVAAALQGGRAAVTHVHVIGDRPVDDSRLTVHAGTVAGPGTVPFGFDLSVPLLRALRRVGAPDVVFIHGSDSPGASLCAEASLPAPVIAAYHGGATGGRDRLKDLATRHVVLRREVGDEVAAAGYPRAAIVEVTPTIAARFFSTARDARVEGRAVIGFVGRPTEGKGADAIGPTARALRGLGLDVVVEVVGATHLDDVSTLRAELLGVGCELRSRGYLPNADLATIMATWDVLLLPSRFEGCPRSLLEAAAIGVPVVCVAGVVPAKVVDGALVRAVERTDLPRAVAEAFAADADHILASTAGGPRSQSHVEGAAELDQIVADLPEHRPASRVSPTAAAANLGRIARRNEPLLRALRPVLHRVRPPRGAT